MTSSRIRPALAWILIVLLALLYSLAALGKFSGAQLDMFTGWGYPVWFMYGIGVLELAGAIGLLIPATTRWAIYGLSLIMVGAAGTHLFHGEGLKVIRPLLFSTVLWAVWWLRRPTPMQKG